MRPTALAPRPPPNRSEQGRWHEVLRALREARGVTQEGWAAQLGVSRKTVQRWEAGERAPDPGAEAALLRYCRQRDLFRAFTRGPLAGLELTPETLHDLLAEARFASGRQRAEADEAPTAPTAPTAPPLPHRSSSNLPAALTSFIGREQELAAVRRALGGTRLLTLTGAGGVGKTRLALELAEELLWGYPHGVCLVELAALADPALVPATVAAALGLRTTDQRPSAEVLVEHLAPRHLLLILDNCEHLAAACAALTETLLRACPTLEVVATSREPLGVGGETLWRVPPLSLPGATADVAEADAARLFVERARQYRPDFSLTAANESAVARICERLDGIPLAIELAAARVKVLTVEQIAERLSDRFRLLTGGSRTALPRHQTLRATLEWSHDLLEDAERALLHRLSVFAGGFALEAAEAVCGEREQGTGNREQEGVGTVPSEDVLDLLTRLVEKSLAIAEATTDSPRFRMLETVRQYASEELDQTAHAGEARACHVAWCTTLAQAAETAYRGPDEPVWLARLEQEHDNLRAALTWALEHGEGEQALRIAVALPRFWEICGHLHEGRDWLVRTLAEAGEVPVELQAKALRGSGFLAEMQGHYAAARDFHAQHLSVQRTLGSAQGIAEAQGDLGRAAARQGDHAVAREFLEASLAGHRRSDNKPGIASVQGSLGMMALQQGDHEQARTRIEERLALNRAMGNKDGTADALDDLAFVAAGQGDIDRQVALLEESMTLWRELNSKNGVAFALSGLGIAAWAKGEYDRALALAQEGLALYRELGDTRGIAWALERLSILALSQRENERAEAWCLESLERYQKAGDAWGLGRSLVILARAAFRNGKSTRAVRLFGAAASLNGRLGVSSPPTAGPGYERALAALRQALGELAFDAAWTAGQAMDEAAALAYALAEPDPD